MIQKQIGVLLAVLLLISTGCVSTLRDADPVFRRNTEPSLPAQQRAMNAAGSAAPMATTAKTVTRGQSPNDYFGGRQNGQVQPAGYQVPSQPYPGYGPSPSSAVQPVQYTSPESLWGVGAAGNGGGVSPYSPPTAAAPGANYPAPSVYSATPALPNGPYAAQPGALWGQGTPNPATAGTFGGPVGQPNSGGGILGLPTDLADIIVNVQEAQTGKFMVGAAVNSDAGVTGQIVIDERNFDWRAFPTSFDDLLNGGAFRGAGQGLRIEALPGSVVQRYMVQFTEPYLFNTRISMNLSGYLFDRQFFDWDEQRLGGRFGLGYRVTPDMSLAASLRAEQVKIRNPRVPGVTELDEIVGRHDLYSMRFNLVQDTRDIPFAPTQGYYFEAGFEQVFGSFDYPKFDLDLRRYFLLAERPDGSGRHVLGFTNKLGISGEETPAFENYFAGGYSTLRGFDFRRASPQSMGVTIGGRFQMLGSAEYLFPITADDMVKGVAFVDYGTVEEDVKIEAEDFRVTVGMGLRINIPALGSAPIALDFGVPIAREETDEIRGFSFWMGGSR